MADPNAPRPEPQAQAAARPEAERPDNGRPDADAGDLRARIADLEHRYRQALADFDNFRKRVAREAERQRAEERAKEKKSVRIKRAVMVMSWNGRGFTRLVLRSYYDQRITLNDVSSYLGAKVKHIPALEHAAFQPAD